jgi:hypothetical protein
VTESTRSLIRFTEGGHTSSSRDFCVVATFVDTEREGAEALVRRHIGSNAEEILAQHPARYILHVLWPDNTSWMRLCPDEELVLYEAAKIARDTRQILPQMLEVLLLLGPELHERVRQTMLAEERRRLASSS